MFVFSYPLMTGENGIVTYNPVLKRYFLPNYSFIQANLSTPLAWHNSIYDMHRYHHRSQITIFESDHPWGPWRLVRSLLQFLHNAASMLSTGGPPQPLNRDASLS